jgi:hypothetical protein
VSERIFEPSELVRQLRATAEHLRIGEAQTRYRPRGGRVDLGELCRRGNASYELAIVMGEILRTLARDAAAASRLAGLSDRDGRPDPRSRAKDGAVRLTAAAEAVERAVAELRVAEPLLTGLRADPHGP